MSNSIPKEHAEMILEAIKIKEKMTEKNAVKVSKELALKAKDHASKAYYDYKDLKYKFSLFQDVISVFTQD
jgi:hypothetical protein